MSAVTMVPDLMRVVMNRTPRTSSARRAVAGSAKTSRCSRYDLRRLHHRVEQHVGPGRRPLRSDVLVLVVAEAVDAGAHDHGGRRHAVDPAGVVAGARYDVAVRIAEPL